MSLRDELKSFHLSIHRIDKYLYYYLLCILYSLLSDRQPKDFVETIYYGGAGDGGPVPYRSGERVGGRSGSAPTAQRVRVCRDRWAHWSRNDKRGGWRVGRAADGRPYGDAGIGGRAASGGRPVAAPAAQKQPPLR